jgi:hypothetical protein
MTDPRRDHVLSRLRVSTSHHAQVMVDAIVAHPWIATSKPIRHASHEAGFRPAMAAGFAAIAGMQRLVIEMNALEYEITRHDSKDGCPEENPLWLAVQNDADVLALVAAFTPAPAIVEAQERTDVAAFFLTGGAVLLDAWLHLDDAARASILGQVETIREQEAELARRISQRFGMAQNAKTERDAHSAFEACGEEAYGVAA